MGRATSMDPMNDSHTWPMPTSRMAEVVTPNKGAQAPSRDQPPSAISWFEVTGDPLKMPYQLLFEGRPVYGFGATADGLLSWGAALGNGGVQLLRLSGWPCRSCD